MTSDHVFGEVRVLTSLEEADPEKAATPVTAYKGLKSSGGRENSKFPIFRGGHNILGVTCRYLICQNPLTVKKFYIYQMLKSIWLPSFAHGTKLAIGWGNRS